MAEIWIEFSAPFARPCQLNYDE